MIFVVTDDVSITFKVTNSDIHVILLRIIIRMIFKGEIMGEPNFHPYTPIRLYDVNNTALYDPTPRSGEILYSQTGVLIHLNHDFTTVKSVDAQTREGTGDGLNIGKKDCTGYNLLQCDKHTMHSSEEQLAIIAQEFSAEARKLASQRNELKLVADDFAIEAEKLAAKRHVVKLKAAMNSFGMSVTRKSEEELGMIAEEFSTEAEHIATQRLALRLKVTMNNLGLSLMNTSEYDLRILADGFRSEAELLANRRRNASETFSQIELTIIADEFAKEARQLAATRQAMKQINTITNKTLKARPCEQLLPKSSSETVASQNDELLKQTVVTKPETRVRKTVNRQRPSRVSHEADKVNRFEIMSKQSSQQIALMFLVETPRQAHVKTKENHSKEIVTRQNSSRVSPTNKGVSKYKSLTEENIHQIALMFRVETPTEVTKNNPNVNEERKNTSRLSSVLVWFKHLRGVVFGSG